MNLLIATALIFSAPDDEKLNALYARLNPNSIAEHLAFYQLYSKTALGSDALTTSLELLGIQNYTEPLTPKDASPFLSLMQRHKGIDNDISEEALTLIEKAARRLSNRKLQGFYIQRAEDALPLKDTEIDVSEALLHTQLQDCKAKRKMRAMLDLMALQLLARLPKGASHDEKIDAINQLLFTDMGFRFPPQSTFQQKIDTFTLLPSVIEERKGVCLGVSLIYISLAQRIDLPLEIVTPPGHIYIRCGPRNIETTMHGVHLHDEAYFGISTRRLHMRTHKEAIGLSYINQASLSLSAERYEEALQLYTKAALYIKDDPLLDELTGITLFLLGKDAEAKKYLVRSLALDGDDISGHSLPDDILQARAPREAIQPLFYLVSEKRESVERKKLALEKIVAAHPDFRTALFQLALCCLELNQPKEALLLLEKRSSLAHEDLSTEYILASLWAARNNMPQAKNHFLRAKKIALKEQGAARGPALPPALQELEFNLFYSSPDGLQNN